MAGELDDQHRGSENASVGHWVNANHVQVCFVYFFPSLNVWMNIDYVKQVTCQRWLIYTPVSNNTAQLRKRFTCADSSHVNCFLPSDNVLPDLQSWILNRFKIGDYLINCFQSRLGWGGGEKKKITPRQIITRNNLEEPADNQGFIWIGVEV